MYSAIYYLRSLTHLVGGVAENRGAETLFSEQQSGHQCSRKSSIWYFLGAIDGHNTF
jgi:hypothetical protein